MATETSAQSATTSTEDRKKAVMRQLNGTSFLTLEHVGYFVLVVLLPVLLLAGATIAMQLWQSKGSSGSSVMPLMYSFMPIMQSIDTSAAMMLTSAFIILAPLMYCLRRRISAEYARRPGYTNRVGYKLPVYTALGVLVASTIGAFGTMLGVFLNSLANIGVTGADIGQMYIQQFLPALLSFAVFGMAAWYTMWFAKGKDSSRVFVNIIGLLAAIMAITLFITTLTLNHDTKSNTIQPQPQPYPLQDNQGSNNYLQY